MSTITNPSPSFPSHTQTLGVDLVVMTPSRGYSAELAATAIIALASTYGLPISTTQVIVSFPFCSEFSLFD